MAKLLLLVATLLVAAVVVAKAHTAAPAPALATRPAVTAAHRSAKSGLLAMKLVSPVVSRPVVAFKGKWTAIKPALVSAKHTTLLVSVTVENSKNVVVNKTLKLNLLQHFKKLELRGKKYVVLTAAEIWSWKSKDLLFTMGEVVVLSIKR